jgi:hypothetical protein
VNAVHRRLPGVWLHGRPGGWIPPAHLWCDLTWLSTDPHQVDLKIDRSAPWQFGWELLRDGHHTPSGVGDVFITPHPNGIFTEIVLASPDGQGSLQLSALDLAEFIHDVTAVWAEHDYEPEMDVWLAGLLNPHRRPAPPPPAGGVA